MKKSISEIKGYEQFKDYDLYDDGRIISHKKGKTKEIRGSKDNKGYLRIDLDYKTKKGVRIHRLIALAFVPNPENKPQINHINCNKTDNRASNLEWCTNSENQIHANMCGLINHSYNHDKKATPVYQYSLNGDFIAEYNSVGKASIAIKGLYNKTAASNIYNCCIGKFKTAYGFKWSHSKVQRLSERSTHKCVEMGGSPKGDEDIV